MTSSCKEQSDPLSLVIEEDTRLRTIASNPEYEVQILYTQIDRDSLNQPSFRTYAFGVNEDQYFYPASTVKFPAVLLALEKMNQLGLPSDARMKIDSAYAGQSKVWVDSTADNLEPSVAHYAKKILLVSDNDAFNRLYEFVGQDDFNLGLQDKGYRMSSIHHRLSIPLSAEENARTNPLSLYIGDSLVYRQEEQIGKADYQSAQPILKGKGYLSGEEIINEPFDFSSKNYFPLREQHEMIQALIFPESFPDRAFDLRPADRQLVLKYSSILPGESEIEAYQDVTHYWDAYAKFLMYGSEPGIRIPSNIRIFNKIGLAYGFSIDNAYIIDTDRKIEFFLSAVIHTNPNQIYNDGIYTYEETAFPFLARLGQLIYQLEVDRTRTYPPIFENILMN